VIDERDIKSPVRVGSSATQVRLIIDPGALFGDHPGTRVATMFDERLATLAGQIATPLVANLGGAHGDRDMQRVAGNH
jgi:hypothetical protein